jgi:lipopolysaccharide/colanic/teichoic acid biosynthesis glycosyltransferase
MVITRGSAELSWAECAAKRLLDLAAAMLLALVFLPAFLLIAVAISLESPGPVFFRQERLGKAGKRFRLLKFRTMFADAEAVLKRNPDLYVRYVENNFKLREGEDPRITNLGRILRKSSLDELPQLFNVLRGDMSLVGPRPVVPAEIGAYGEGADLLLSIRPGLTGPWQVNGRSRVGYPIRVQMELEYVRDPSLGRDIEILLKTVRAVLRSDGAF